MPSASSPDLALYFDDPRLRMTAAGRLFVRVLRYVGYLFFLVLTATLLLSDLPTLRAWGALLLLFFLDRAFHFREPDMLLRDLLPKGRVNAAAAFGGHAFAALERAFDRSALGRTNFYLEAVRDLLHLAEVHEGLVRLDVSLAEFKEKTDEYLEQCRGKDVRSAEERRAQAAALALRAFARALDARHECVEPSDLFSALPQVEDAATARLFNLFSLTPDDIASATLLGEVAGRFGVFSRPPESLGGFAARLRRGRRHRVMNRAWTSRPTPTLDRYSTDFTDLARAGEVGLLIGHESEFTHLLDVLARPVDPNALLVGEAGIGKETIVAHLAFRLVKDEVPAALFDKRLVGLDLTTLVAGATPEELQARLRAIAEEIVIAGNIILYLPDIHNLVRTSGTAYLSAADALMPVVMNNSFPVVGTTYPREYKEYIEPRSDFAGAFEAIRVNEISAEDARRIMIYQSVLLERHARVRVSFGAIKTAVALAARYFHSKFLPSSSEELLKSAIVEAERRGEKIVSRETVVRTAEAKVNIPIHEATGEEAERLLHLEDTIHERLIDQAEAVKAVSDALREYRSGLARKGGPIATFLFVGPTGVGKTELAKILARVQFGAETFMVRFDMSEYKDKQSFMRFIGSPDGTVPGALTDAILEKPYSLILLDEFEKAYPEILDLFLQVFDDGRLTDHLGRTVNFENTIIIATSNAHSDIINEALEKGEGMTDIAEYLKRRLTDVFKPELLNRFSRIVVFKNLAPDDLVKIAALNLADVAAALAPQGITLTADESAVRLVAKMGYDPAFGARPLRRVIDEKIRAALAEEILRKGIGRGSRLSLTADGDTFRLVQADGSAAH